MAQKTAVEWLIDWIGKNQYFIWDDLLQAFEQAKDMEKEQVEKAIDDALNAYGIIKKNKYGANRNRSI